MTSSQIEPANTRKPLRLWPGVALVAVMWLLLFVVPRVFTVNGALGPIGALVCGLLFVVWWVLFSRAPWAERLGGLALIVGVVVLMRRFVDESITTAGMGVTFFVYVTPVLTLSFLIWAAASHRLGGRRRWATMIATIVAACAIWLPFRTDGITGDGNQDFEWRWAETHEDRLLARAADEPPMPESKPAREPAAAATGAYWPGFRGADRDSIIRGLRIETDWAESPPVELWRQPIGPGWSSFAVSGDLLYTQEQRGEEEVVSCYSATTGELVWRHADAARFWESHAGAGPRATPALAAGRVYTLGATGILNALDATDGSVVWSRAAAADTGKQIPPWGFSSSPLIVDDLVIIQAGKLAAYELVTGEPRWFGPERGGSYSSPHLVTLDGVAQILMQSGAGLTSVAPADGSLLWQHPWAGNIVQPAQTAAGDLLISAAGEMGPLGIRRIAVSRVGGVTASAELRGSGGWAIEEGWTSIGLKPNFSDFVVHKGHAFGFDGRILACIDLEDGERKWKGGRFGSGQLMLLPDQDALLVVSERGELALVEATPDAFTELARLPAIEGKTWNHPVLVGDLLLVRNSQEMAAFRLASAAL